MAIRPVFLPADAPGFVTIESVEFAWFPGFSVAQKQRSIESLHHHARKVLNVSSILEVSTKSPDPTGVRLSAFHLRVEHHGSGRLIPVEAAFQGSKIFRESGQHPDLYLLESGREIKARMRDRAAETVECFDFDGVRWPLVPTTAFYDWLYLRGLQRLFEVDEHGLDRFVRFEAFTDIEFNPSRSIACQARSCALYIALRHLDLLDALSDRDHFLDRVTRPAEFIDRIEQPRLFPD